MAFLTADHGAVTVPGLEKARGLPVDYWNPEPMKPGSCGPRQPTAGQTSFSPTTTTNSSWTATVP